ILFYDYFLTLDLEVECFWGWSAKGFATLLFYINRYLSLLGNIPIIIFSFWPERVLHHNVSKLDTLLLSMQSLITLSRVLFILRLYALYDKDKRILGFLCIVTTGMV
ncbi:hypothetical protein BDP27DRAFT_1153872, partial [Rhodocollybia butyracea]